MSSIPKGSGVVLSFLFGAITLAHPQAFTRIDLPQPVESAALSVTPEGDAVVGWTQVGDERWAIRWTFKGGMEILGDLSGGGVYAEANAAALHGTLVVGASETDIGLQAFTWTPQTGMQVVTDAHMPMFCSAAYDVSHDGRFVVGQAYNCGCGTDGRAFRWSLDTGFQMLPIERTDAFEILPQRAMSVSADGGVIVGQARSSFGTEAFMWSADFGSVGLGDLPGGPFFSIANAVSADGQVIVGQSWGENGPEAFLYRPLDDAGMVPLGDLPDGMWNSDALAVCGDGSVIVGVASTLEGDEAFVWDADNGMRSLKFVLEHEYGQDLTGWRLTAARGTCFQGRTVVGTGINPAGQPDMWVAKLLPPEKQPKGRVGGTLKRPKPR